ncbi:MAG TPA: EAL domain-containing response regulator [Thermoanaerobaculia bacterium]|nr:EAL domain-containing response regulator [Thermoanaerobaculia bacterium]
MNEMVLVVDDEPSTRAGVAVAVGSTGRRVVTCGDIESAQMVMERLPVRSVVTDMRLTGPFSDDGLRFIEFVVRHAPQSRVVLMTGSSSPELRREARLRGAVAVLEKPFTTAQIDAVLTGDDTGGSTQPDIIDVPQIEDVLAGTRLYSVFQPIVSIDSVEPLTFGYEALARVDTPGPMHAPEFLFEYSSRKRCMTALELLCMENSVRDGALLPPATSIFINLHPAALADRRIVDGLIAATAQHGLVPQRVVLEITEQAAMSDVPQTLENVDALAAAGFRFAFDDVGVAYSHLLHLERVRPAFMKISQEFGADFHRNDFKAKIVRNVVALAQDFGCDVILEGVEDPRVVDAARAMGIRYVQGFLFGRPQRAKVWLD